MNLNMCLRVKGFLSTSPFAVTLIAVVFLSNGIVNDVKAGTLNVKVIKACEKCKLPAAAEPCASMAFHRDQAAVWVPDKNVKIYAVSIPEQTEIALYTDIEVSTAPKMYLRYGHIFRAKYAGPAIQRDPPCEVTYSGSNITNTNINFAPNWIWVPAGKPIYVHMDVYNWTPYDINPMTQDVYLYYTNSN